MRAPKWAAYWYFEKPCALKRIGSIFSHHGTCSTDDGHDVRCPMLQLFPTRILQLAKWPIAK
eukprot:7060136-Alexandrium_andersonii.AAC.1